MSSSLIKASPRKVSDKLLTEERNKKNNNKKSESVGQTLPQLPWKQKRGDLKKC
jgi:hypothetical protein